MSLLADKDYLLQSLQLSYIRHVLPSYSTQTSLSGVGPHNLITFDTYSPIFQSPYVVLGGLTNESKWPELKSGRNSPPLGIGRGSVVGNNSNNNSSGGGELSNNRRRRTNLNDNNNNNGLSYSQTIVGKGSGKSGAGMRVGGRERTWKGKGVAENSVEEGGIIGTSVSRRKSLETSLHIRRIGLDNSLPKPPPVIIHSPVHSNLDRDLEINSEVRSYKPSSIPLSPLSLSEDQYATKRSSIDYSDDGLISADLDIDSPALKDNLYDEEDEEEAQNSFGEEEESSAGEEEEENDSISPLPLSTLAETNQLPSNPIDTPLNRLPPFARDGSGGGELIDELEDGSLTSSGASLFGVSRMTGTSDGAIISRERSDSDSSSLQMTKVIEKSPELVPLPTTIEGEEIVATGPELVLPKGMRVRERRRVNISSRMLLPIAEPHHEEDHLEAVGTTTGVILPLTEATTTTTALPVTPITPIKSKQLPLLRTASLPKPNTLLLPLTPSRQTPSLTFPRSQISPFSKTTTTTSSISKRSALTALLSSNSNSTSTSNPFSSLYASLVSKASDSLKLNLYFPHSKTPNKKLMIGVKKDLTVEEVLGVGLWFYWEENREPKLEIDSKGEGIEDETTKWNLRIVEDFGEVDEDFPALDRSRAVSAFSFGEFAIVKATDQQIKDNKLKQAKIQRRASRVLSPPKRNLPLINQNELPVPISDKIIDNSDTKDNNNDRIPIRQMSIQNNDPNASIFKQPNQGNQPQIKAGTSTTTPAELSNSNYQRYTVQRKLPMPLGRHPRTIVIDGDYIHLINSETVTGTGSKTVSFHISAMIQCKVSKRSPTTFKLIVKSNRNRIDSQKRYDFDAEDKFLAKEIVENVNRIRIKEEGERKKLLGLRRV